MYSTTIENSALQFGVKQPCSHVILSNGLIHQTYHVWNEENSIGIVLQEINDKVFQSPQAIIDNYLVVYNYLKKSKSFLIPTPLCSISGSWLYIDEEKRVWRANEFIENSYTENIPITESKAYKAAYSFSQLTKALLPLSSTKLTSVIPHFHNLAQRFNHFEDALLIGD